MLGVDGSVIVIDDHPLILAAMPQLIATLSASLKVHCFRSIEDALAGCSGSNNIKLFILDYCLPFSSGLNGIQSIKRNFQNVPILVYSGINDMIVAKHTIRYGASAYITKSTTIGELLPEISHLLTHGQSRFPIVLNGRRDDLSAINLSKKQLQLIELLCNGLTNREISEQLAMAEITTKKYLSFLYEKFEVRNRSELVSKVKNGVLQLQNE